MLLYPQLEMENEYAILRKYQEMAASGVPAYSWAYWPEWSGEWNSNPADYFEHDPTYPAQSPLPLSKFWRCPSAPEVSALMNNFHLENIGKGNNYAACFGGGLWGPSATPGSATAGLFGVTRYTKSTAASTFQPGTGLRLSGVPDGLSNTVAVSEVLGVEDARDGRGVFLWPGCGGSTFVTHTAPNSPTPDRVQACAPGMSREAPCTEWKHPENASGLSPVWGELWAAARSRHSGGVNAVFGDGSVRFVRNGISEVTWRALGTASGGEVLGNDW